ncbi:hypothetical protein Dimus_039230 [Dionaea muscipula]
MEDREFSDDESMSEEEIAASLKEEEEEKEEVEVERERKRKRKEKMKKKLQKEAKKAKMRGVCYVSRVPPKMDPLKFRQILSQYADIERIYLAPEDPSARVQRKKARGFRGQGFSEGWVEFTNKREAKRVADMLNGEQIGGRKRSQFYYDLWNIKYLTKFKWDDLTEENVLIKAVREQKLSLEISAAKKERDFYLSKVEQSRTLSSIEERLKKKRKVQPAQENVEHLENQQLVRKVFRQFPQTRPVAEEEAQRKPMLSKDVLAKVFNTSSR